MSKEKNLAEEQKERRDQQGRQLKEQQTQAENTEVLLKSGRVGMLTGLVLCVAFIIVRLILKQPWQDLGALYCSIFCGRYFYKWARQSKNTDMLFGILWGVAAAAFLIFYFIVIL